MYFFIFFISNFFHIQTMWSQICHFIGRLKTGSMHLRQLRVCAHIVGDTNKATNLKAVTIKATVIILTAVCVLFLQSSCPVFFSGLLNSQVAQRVRSVWAWRYGRGRPWTPSNFNRAHHALPFYVIENIKKTLLFCLWKKRWDFGKKRGCKKNIKKPQLFCLWR